MPEPFQYDVFLSHNRGDKPHVLRLAERLRREGLRVWLDDWVVRPGDDIYLEIERGLEASRTLILCMSPAAFGSDWVGLERSTVLFRDPANQDRRFIPLLLVDCDLPDTLRRFKYVDYRAEADVAFHELLAACRPETEAPASVPEPPSGVEPEAAEPLAVLERKLKGHKGLVRSVAVSPDGKWVVSGSDDETVKIWDLETSECVKTLEGHKDRVRAVTISCDGQRILSGSFDKTIKIWDASTGRSLATWRDHEGPVLALAISRDGRRVLSGAADVYLVIRDTTGYPGESSWEAGGPIRWMNVSEYLRTRRNKKSRQIVFEGEKLDAPALWRLRDRYFPRGC